MEKAIVKKTFLLAITAFFILTQLTPCFAAEIKKLEGPASAKEAKAQSQQDYAQSKGQKGDFTRPSQKIFRSVKETTIAPDGKVKEEQRYTLLPRSCYVYTDKDGTHYISDVKKNNMGKIISFREVIIKNNGISITMSRGIFFSIGNRIFLAKISGNRIIAFRELKVGEEPIMKPVVPKVELIAQH